MAQKPTDYQILNDYFTGNIDDYDLTPHQQERLERINHCYRMLNEMRPSIEIVKKLCNTHQLHQSSAWRDLRLTEQIFGDLRSPNKAMKRNIAEKMALDAYRIALDREDVKGMVAAGKLYVEATGCSIEDPEMPEFDKLQPNVYVMVLPPEAEKMMSKLLSEPGPTNLSKIYNDAEATEYTEIPASSGDTIADSKTASDGE